MLVGSYPPLARWVRNSSCDSDFEGAAEAASGIVGFRAVMIDENGVVAAVAKECATEFSNSGRGFDPTRRFQVETPKVLQFSILFFR